MMTKTKYTMRIDIKNSTPLKNRHDLFLKPRRAPTELYVLATGCVLCFAVLVGGFVGVLLFYPSNSLPVNSAMIAGFVTLVSWALLIIGPFFVSIASAYYRAIDYLVMQKLSPDHDPDESWWQSLEKLLPHLRRGNNIPNRQLNFVVLYLRIAVWVARTMSAPKIWQRSWWARRRVNESSNVVVELADV